MYPARRRAPGFGVMLLLYQIFGVFGVNYIPPVTLMIVGLHSAIYLRLLKIPWYKASQVCLSVYNVYYRKEYSRLLYAAFEHGDDWHLYYNMMSFIVKGQALERRLGHIKFLYITSAFTVLTSMTLVGLNILADEYFDKDFGNQCAIGFSGVIFALKVLTSYYNPNYTHQIMGIPILMSAQYAVWAELLLIQLFVPNASFLGHLAGILVGLAYVKGPLGPILDGIYSLFTSFGPPPRRFAPESGQSGYRSYSPYIPHNMDEDEQLRQATENSLHDYSSVSRASYSQANIYPDLDDIRNRRAAYYS